LDPGDYSWFTGTGAGEDELDAGACDGFGL